VVLVLGLLYATVLAVLAVMRPGPLVRWRRLVVVDLALLAALDLFGGVGLLLVPAFGCIPFLVAFVARPASTFAWSTASIAIHPAIWEINGYPGFSALGPVALLMWCFIPLCAVGLSALLMRLDRAVSEHERRTTLAAAIVRAEARERRELADALHDGPAQHIAMACREVASTLGGDMAGLDVAQAAIASAVKQLEGEIVELHPTVLDRCGLSGAVSELAARAAKRGGFATTVTVEQAAAGVDDETVIAVARELLTNAAKHARASHVTVSVAVQAGSCILVEICDDGRGFDPPSAEQAIHGRHFGLQAAGERLRALGGSLDLQSTPEAGTTARVRIPIPVVDRPIHRFRELGAVGVLWLRTVFGDVARVVRALARREHGRRADRWV
jgi:two-component system NarL family sensor kinase